MWYLLLFHCNNSCTNAPHCCALYVLCLSCCFSVSSHPPTLLPWLEQCSIEMPTVAHYCTFRTKEGAFYGKAFFAFFFARWKTKERKWISRYHRRIIFGIVLFSSVSKTVTINKLVVQGDTKKRELLKNPTKIVETPKKIIDRNWTITTCLLRDSNPNYQSLKITSSRSLFRSAANCTCLPLRISKVPVFLCHPVVLYSY
jgi:hypothetical protein